MVGIGVTVARDRFRIREGTRVQQSVNQFYLEQDKINFVAGWELKEMHIFQAAVVVVTEGCTDQNDGTVLNGVSCIRILFVAWMYAV